MSIIAVSPFYTGRRRVPHGPLTAAPATTNLLSQKDMPLVIADALSRDELLAVSERRWEALRSARPDLAPAVDLQQRLLTIVVEAARAIGASRLPRLSLPPKYLAAKLARGVPIFAREPIPVPLGLLKTSLLNLSDALSAGG